MDKNYFKCMTAKDAVLKLVMKSLPGHYLYSDATSAIWYYGYEKIILAVEEYIFQCEDERFSKYQSIELYQKSENGKWVLKKSKYNE